MHTHTYVYIYIYIYIYCTFFLGAQYPCVILSDAPDDSRIVFEHVTGFFFERVIVYKSCASPYICQFSSYKTLLDLSHVGTNLNRCKYYDFKRDSVITATWIRHEVL